MNRKIVILESPAKCKTVEGFCRKLFKKQVMVVSCGGHLLDISNQGEYRLGIDLKTFDVKYRVIPKKKQIVENLRKVIGKEDLGKQEIFLATDNDREGEAISAELVQIFNIKKYKRIIFNEITEKAILNAFKKTFLINQDLVASREARAIIDKMIGYRLSFLLQKKIKARSAGRVQSVILKLVIDRENEISKFKSEKY
jgi:DNA topoisomerase-1